MEDNKQRITIRIAGLDPMELMINPLTEEYVRNAVDDINREYEGLENSYRENRDMILARIAFKFARKCHIKNAIENETSKDLAILESKIDSLLESFQSDMSPNKDM